MVDIGGGSPSQTLNEGPLGGYVGNTRVNFSLSANATGVTVTANVDDTHADGVRIDLDNKNSGTYVQLQKIEVDDGTGWTTVWTGNLLLSVSWESFNFTAQPATRFRFTFDEGNGTGDSSIDMDVQAHELTMPTHRHSI